jgi:hypothetical protein
MMNQFGEICHVARQAQPQNIMTVNDYIKTLAPPPKVLRDIWADSKRQGADKLSMREINAEIAAYRREKRKNRTILQAAK